MGMAPRHALHRLWRGLPRAWRRALYERATALGAPPAEPGSGLPPAPEPPFVVAGCLAAPTGLGEAARLAAEALAASGERVTTIDLTAPLLQPAAVPPPDLPAALPGRGTLLLFVQPPNVARAVSLIGRRLLAGKRRIGCWVWDLEVVPPRWAAQLGFVHELAAPSLFAARAFEAAFGRPVRHLIHPVAVRDLPPAPAAASGLTRFGAAMDLGSTAARKNPLAVVRAYRAAFPSGEPVLLSLKLRDEGAEPGAAAEIRRLAAAPGARIAIASGDFGQDALARWWADLDVLVSLHRSEGFGLVVAEALLRGLPVIATDWSATAEYVDEAVGWPVPAGLGPAEDQTGRYALPGARWAEPDGAEAAARLREAWGDPAGRRRRGEAGRARMRALFSAEAFRRGLTAPLAPAAGALP